MRNARLSVQSMKPLRDYMNKSDVQAFIAASQLDKNKTVLEIGIGTGRLAVEVAPFCKRFTGINISPKPIEGAKQRLGKHKKFIYHAVFIKIRLWHICIVVLRKCEKNVIFSYDFHCIFRFLC